MTSNFRASVEMYIPIKKVVEEERVVLCPVLVPTYDEVTGVVKAVDLQLDAMSKPEIRRSAHQFMADYRLGKTQLGVLHKEFPGDEAMLVVESYLVPDGNSLTFGEDTYPEGAWFIAIKILDDSLWNRVLTGEFKGVSVGGRSKAHMIDDLTAEAA